MFTGIIERVGEVARVTRSAGLMRLQVVMGELAKRTRKGDSVSVDGVCLTATNVAGEAADFDVGEETLSVSTLGDFRVRRRVNLELPLKAGDPLGGHIVQGHGDGVGTIVRVEISSDSKIMGVSLPPALAAEMVLKGSVAVDGVSLTISALTESSFEVYLIPHTLKATTLGAKDVGDRVNIETDILGKYVAKMLAARTGAQSGGVTERMLEEHGFK